jgi:hypothetical protein
MSILNISDAPEANKRLSPFFSYRTYAKKIVILVLFSLAGASACSTVNSRASAPFEPSPTTVLIQNIPFYPQEDFQCGPASLAGVLNYWKTPVTPVDISREIFSASAKGTFTIDMLLYAQKKGLDAIDYIGGMEDLKVKVSQGYPVVVLVDNGFYVYQAEHFMVVVGYNNEGVIVNSGRLEKVLIKEDAFLKSWKRTKYWTLWIKPK